MKNRTRALKEGLDLADPESIDKYVFYKAVLIVIDAVHTFAKDTVLWQLKWLKRKAIRREKPNWRK